MVGMFRLVVNALAECELDCVLSVGSDFDGDLGSFLPGNFRLNREASHLEILPHAALAISHGGMLTTLEALYNGVPSLMIPSHPGAEEVAYRAAELGLGIRLRMEEATKKTIRASVERLLRDSRMLEGVRQARNAFRASGGASEAADRIEQAFRFR